MRLAGVGLGLLPTLALALLLAGSATAGPPALDDSGLVVRTEGSLSPPVAGTRSRPRPVGVEFASFIGNIRDGHPRSGSERIRTLEVRTPQGMRFHHAAIPRCRIEVLDRSGPTACPRGSRIGSGTSVTDARPLLPDFVRVSQALVFNGREGNGRPAMLLWNKVFGVTLTLSLQIRPARRGFGPSFVLDNGPDDAGGTAFTAMSVVIRFPRRTVRVAGRRRGLFEAPTTCRGSSWRWQEILTDRAGHRVVADHRTPCVAAR